MTEIDLDREKFRSQDPKTGRWRVKLSKRLYRNYFFVLVLVLAVVFWHRGEVDSTAMFIGALAFGVPAGGMLALWLMDTY